LANEKAVVLRACGLVGGCDGSLALGDIDNRMRCERELGSDVEVEFLPMLRSNSNGPS